jgi:uncharacterized membrane protein
MSSETEDLRRQIAELQERVSRLEARLSEAAPPETRPADVPPHRSPVIHPASFPPITARPPAPPHASAGSGKSLEARIGSQLFNRVGIVAVLIGVAWFLKLAIDNGWIGPAARVVIGIVAGAGLIGWSERFRATGYRTFSNSLKAIATGILYLSLWAAFALFHLISSEVAFLTMVMVTGLNALMCWMQNSEILAFYAAIGGFITPLLLSVHPGTELTLFSYLLVLDIAVVVLIALRPWSRLLIAAFAGTTFYSVGWYASDYSEEKFGLTLFFILAFFLLFALSPQLLRSLRLATASAGHLIEDSLVLQFLPALNAALGFLEVFILMSNPEHMALRRWTALPFAAFYLLMLRLGRIGALEGAPAALPPIYLVISVLFITIAIPMEAHGRWIAIGWFLEFAVLLWFAASKGIRSLRTVAAWVLALALVALLLPIHGFNPPAAPTVLFNTRFAAYLVAIASCLAAARIAYTASIETQIVPGTFPGQSQSWRRLAFVSGLTATVLLLIAVCLEIHTYWIEPGTSYAVRGNSIDEQFSYSAWFMLCGAALLAAGFWRKSAFLRWQALVLLALSIAKVFLVDMQQLSQGYRILSFLGLGVLLLTVSFAYQKDWLSLRGGAR